MYSLYTKALIIWVFLTTRSDVWKSLIAANFWSGRSLIIAHLNGRFSWTTACHLKIFFVQNCYSKAISIYKYERFWGEKFREKSSQFLEPNPLIAIHEGIVLTKYEYPDVNQVTKNQLTAISGFVLKNWDDFSLNFFPPNRSYLQIEIVLL